MAETSADSDLKTTADAERAPGGSGRKCAGPGRELELVRALGHFVMVGIWAVNSVAYNHPVVVSVVFALCVVWEMLRRIWPVMNELPLVRYTLRRKERRARLTPATFFLIGLMICIKFFSRETVNTAIWVAALADPAARIVGKTWGRLRIWRFRKTFEGSGACFLVTAVIVFVSLTFFGPADPIPLGWVLAAGILAGALVSIGEVLIPSILPALMDDNFWVLVLASTAIYLVLLLQGAILALSGG